MIQRQDLFNIRFYDKQMFYGSFRGMHYRIEKVKEDDTDAQLKVTTWPGPYNYATTDDALKEAALFPYSNEGLGDVCDYLNAYHKEHYEDR